FATNALRIQSRAVLERIIDDTMRQRTAAEWINRLQGAGIPASPVRNFQEVAEHPQSEAREMFPVLDHPTAGRHKVTGTPVKLSATPGQPGAPAPLLGQHTACVLTDLLGLDDSAIRDLVMRGVLFDPGILRRQWPSRSQC